MDFWARFQQFTKNLFKYDYIKGVHKYYSQVNLSALSADPTTVVLNTTKKQQTTDVTPSSTPLETTTIPPTPSFSKNVSISVPRPSLLSSENTENNYRGLINLAILIIFFTQIRLMIENFQKYGILVNTFHHIHNFITSPVHYPMAFLQVSFPLFIILIVYLETLSLWVGYSFVTIFCFYLSPIATIILFKDSNPITSLVTLVIIHILVMKCISFVVEYRRVEIASKKPLKLWSLKENLKRMFWFITFPTLVFEFEPPLSPTIRKSFLVKRILELVFFILLICFIAEQYMLPLVINTMPAMYSGNMIKIVERVLKMTFPMILVWLLIFYSFFHLALNIAAEITRYGDKMFYLDFWNSTDMSYFWRTWNIPVHKWLVRYVYLPLVNRSYSQFLASFMVFFVSAIGHEVIVSVPFRQIRMWSFFAMMAQLPMCSFTAKYTKGKQIGNIIFWMSFMVGQSNILVNYYYDFQKNKNMF